MALLHLCVLFIINYVSCEMEKSHNNPTCMRNCSWSSYDDNHNTMYNECHMTDASYGYDCPNSYGQTSEPYVSNVKVISVRFNSIPAIKSESSTETTLCVNITFKVERGALSTMKAIRFTAISTSYEDQGQVFCQLWEFPTELNACSFSEENCSPDGDKERTFFNDCICDIAPGPGSLSISVDVLPKQNSANQVFQASLLPECESPDLKNNEYCTLTPVERWQPVYSSSKQLCPISSGSISVTFDLAPEQYGIQEYFLFLYKLDHANRTCKSTNPAQEHVLNKASTPIFEQTFSNKSVNMTTNSFDDQKLNTSYIFGIKIKDDPPKDVYYKTHFLCNTSIVLQTSPCNSNSCPIGEVCVADCLDYRCQCSNGTTRVDKECSQRWQPVNREQLCSDSSSMHVTFDLAPEQYGYQEYFVFLYKATSNPCDPDGIGSSELEPIVNKTIFADKTVNVTVSFDNLTRDAQYFVGIKVKDKPPDGEVDYQTHLLCDTVLYTCPVWWKNMYILIGGTSVLLIILLCVITALIWRSQRKPLSSEYLRADNTSGNEVELPESPSSGRSKPRAIRLFCNSNWQLQNFADELRGILQRRVKCNVSLETLWDVGGNRNRNWITDAAKDQAVVCFIWDRNLSILDEVKTPIYMTHQMLEALPKSQSKRVIILSFDVTPSDELPLECSSFKLPSGLTDLVKEFHGESNEDDCEILGSAYADMMNYVRKILCLRSEEEWAQSPKFSPDNDDGNCDDDYDDNESLLSIEEVDADDEILVKVMSNLQRT